MRQGDVIRAESIIRISMVGKQCKMLLELQNSVSDQGLLWYLIMVYVCIKFSEVSKKILKY